MDKKLTDAEKWYNEYILTRNERDEANLALASLCDIVLGEDAEDRTNDTLVKETGKLKRDYDAIRSRKPYVCDICWTASWAPCEEGTHGALKDPQGGWMICQCCSLHEALLSKVGQT